MSDFQRALSADLQKLLDGAKDLCDADLAILLRGLSVASNSVACIAHRRELIVDWRISPRHNDRPASVNVTIMTEVA